MTFAKRQWCPCYAHHAKKFAFYAEGSGECRGFYEECDVITFSFHGDNWTGYGRVDQGYVTPVGGDGTRKVCGGGFRTELFRA